MWQIFASGLAIILEFLLAVGAVILGFQIFSDWRRYFK